MSKVNPLFFTICLVLSVSSVAIAAIVTHHTGIVDVRFKLGPGSGQITIDGRSTQPPTLPPGPM